MLLGIIAALVTCAKPHFCDFPIKLWADSLQGFQHRDLILNGLHSGFDIGELDIHPEPYYSAPFQFQLEPEVQLAITEWIARGVTSGFILGPFKAGKSPFPNLHCSPLFAVPKPNGDWRPIHHLSYPKDPEYGISINAILDPALKEVHYTSFYDVLRLVDNVGKGGYLWLVDAKDAYYRVPIAEKFYKYMGIEWLGHNFVFTSLQMGLGTACQLYTKFADAVEYIIFNNRWQADKSQDLFVCPVTGAKLIWHYLDDFFGGASNYLDALDQFEEVYHWMSALGIPTTAKKVIAPAQIQKILGFVYSTIDMTVSVPYGKIVRLQSLVSSMLRNKFAYKKDLERLLGLLMWVSVVAFPCKAFARRLERSLHLEAKNYVDKVYLSEFVLEDLKWWAKFLRSGKLVGAPIKWLLKRPEDADIEVKSDAATKEGTGIGGFSSEGVAFQVKLVDTNWDYAVKFRPSLAGHGVKISVLEMMGALIAARLWGHKWTGKCVTFYNDNPSAAGAIINKNAKLQRHDINYMIRDFAELAVNHSYKFWGVKVDGDENVVADALSRFEKFESHSDYVFESQEAVIKIVNEILNELMELPENLL